jgi:RNA polymerase sigma-70 factor (ECF subfamily)
MDPLAASYDRWRRLGDLRALGEVFDALAPRLLPVAMHLCGHAADAEDALQQTFLLAMDRAAAFDATQRLEPWLAGLLQNVVRNQKRSAARRRTEPLPECASDEQGPLDRAERDELIAKLRTHVDALPADQRQVVRLQLRHGLSPTAIAEALELPPGAVRMRLHRGLEALRRFLPASLAALLAASLPAHGLAFVREQVLRAGAARVAAAGASAVTVGSVAFGGAVMTKKLMAAFVLFGALGALWWFGGVPPLATPPEAPPDEPLAATAAQGDVPSVPDADPAAASRFEVTVAAGVAAAREPGPTELWGLVVDATTQQPIAGATIELRHRDADEFWNLDLDYGERVTTLARANSDADGRFRFDVVRARPHRLAVRAVGYAATTALQRTGGSVVTIALSRGAVLTGVVRCDGKPVADASVRLAVRGETVELAKGSSDDAGAFRFVDLPAAEVYVQVVAPSFAEDWTRLDVTAGGSHHVEVELDAGKVLRGRVVDAATGLAIADARIADSWTMTRAVRSDAEGRFRLGGVKPDSHAMCHVEAAGYASATRRIASRLDDELEVRLARGGEVVGRIVDAVGAPVAGVYAAVCASYWESPGMQGSDWIPARIAADGRFTANGLRADQHYWLMARAPGFGVRVYALARRLEDAERLDVGDVVMRPAGGIEGRVVDDTGTPLAGMSVSVRGANDDRGAWLAGAKEPEEVSQFTSRSARTDDRGRFRLPSLAGGKYTVSVRPKGRDRETSVAIELGDGELRENVELAIATGLSIRGQLIALDGRPFVETVYVNAMAEEPGTWERFSATAGPDGAFQFEGLPEGLYTITVMRTPKGQVLPPQFHVRAGDTVRWQLEAPSFLAGRVVDAEGKPVRAQVYAFHEGVSAGASIHSTEPDGSFRLEVPASFRGSVGAQDPENRVTQGSATDVVAGQTDLRITLGQSPFQRR